MEQITTGSQFYNHAVRITESMSLDNTSTGESVDCNIVVKSSTLIFDTGVTLTIGEGKTLIPDLNNVYAKSPKY